jgi:PAS domain-containing protein
VFVVWVAVLNPIRSRSRSNKARVIVESSPDAMITVSANGFIESFNPAATRLFGWPENKPRPGNLWVSGGLSAGVD